MMLISPSVAEIANELCDPTVKVAVLGLSSVGWLTTVTGYEVKAGCEFGKRLDCEPSAIGAIWAVNVPRVPAGGVPKSVAVPFPLSARDNHEGADPRLHETGVCAPTEVKTIELGAFVMNVASDGGPMLAAGAGAILMPKP